MKPADLGKLPLPKDEIERLIISDLRTFAGCEQAVRVVVVAIENVRAPASWTVSCLDIGRSDGEACDRALQHIVPSFQRVYDLVGKH